jgi:hypothetical protein
MPGGSTAQRGNELFAQALYLTITPPVTVTTATQTQGTVIVPGVQVGDIITANLTTVGTNYNALLSLNAAYVSAPNNVVVSWTTEGATVSSAGPQTVLMEVTRPENTAVSGVAGLPNAVV